MYEGCQVCKNPLLMDRIIQIFGTIIGSSTEFIDLHGTLKGSPLKSAYQVPSGYNSQNAWTLLWST